MFRQEQEQLNVGRSIQCQKSKTRSAGGHTTAMPRGQERLCLIGLVWTGPLTWFSGSALVTFFATEMPSTHFTLRERQDKHIYDNH